MQVECMAEVQRMDCEKNELHRGNIASDEGRIISGMAWCEKKKQGCDGGSNVLHMLENDV